MVLAISLLLYVLLLDGIEILGKDTKPVTLEEGIEACLAAMHGGYRVRFSHLGYTGGGGQQLWARKTS
jgi:hypothetical protein